MKHIFIAIVCLLGSMSLQSCLHDDKEFFDESAANRIESTVENTQKILESSENGWQLHYFTGKGMTGGGYTFLMKFANGKVTVAGDTAVAAPAERATSSYTVDRSMGPVLSFNTYNDIFHFLGEPTYGNIEGEQGDWEFVITKLTEDSIFVKGKKWENEMVFTRMADGVDWTSYLDSIADVQKRLGVNYSVGNSSDASKMVEINSATRRILSRTADGQMVEQPFYVTPTGIHAVNEPVALGEDKAQDFLVSKAGVLTAKGNEALTLNSYAPSIDTWVGNWTLSAMQGSCDMTISKVEDQENMLKGTFTAGGYTYNIGLSYNPETGALNLPSQLIDDPSGRYPALWLMNADLNQGTLLGQGGMNVVWHGVSQEGDFEDDGTLASEGYASDTFIALACTAKGEPIKENGQYVFVIEWYYLSNLTPNK